MPGPNDKTTTSRGTTESQPQVTTQQDQQGGMMGMPVQMSMPDSIQVDPKRLLWVGGLLAVGALGVIEWPVVAAVGVGSYVAEQFAKESRRRSATNE